MIAHLFDPFLLRAMGMNKLRSPVQVPSIKVYLPSTAHNGFLYLMYCLKLFKSPLESKDSICP